MRQIILPDSINAEKIIKKLLGEKDIEEVLQRLDRLTLDEARITAAQTLEVVYGLFENIKVVMDSKQMPNTLVLSCAG
jgi:gamma-glutamyl phosphate reductase